MTVAICLFCGSFKGGAFTKCPHCGEMPSTKNERSDSIALTDHFHDRQTLELFSAEIKSGSLPSVDPSIAAHFLQTMDSEEGMKIATMSQDKKPEQLPLGEGNSQEIASRLVMIESNYPGAVRMKHNPSVIPLVVQLLKTLRFKKPLFMSQHQFVFNTVLSYVPPLQLVLPTCILAGPSNDKHLVECWWGTGRFAGHQGMLQLFDFSSSGKNRVPLIIEIKPFFDQISDLLDKKTVVP